MSEVNGVDGNLGGPMAGWVIVLSNCKQLVGRLHSALQQAEAIQRSLRSADAGIALVGAMPRGMPPAPGRAG